MICHKLARAQGLQPIAAFVPPLRSADGSPIKNHGVHQLTLHLKDAHGVAQQVEITAVAIRRDAGAPPVLLSNPTLAELGVELKPASNTWRFGAAAVAEPSEFARQVVEGGVAYVAQLTTVSTGDQTAYLDAEEHVEGLDEEPPDDPESILAQLPQCLRQFVAQFSTTAAKKLPMLEGAEHSIDLESGKQPPAMPIYALSERQLHVLREYLGEGMETGRIVHSVSPAGAPVLFVPKKDGTLRLCVDYRGLNKVTIKNRYPLPLIGELFDRFSEAKYFSKIDLTDAYHRIRIKPSDRWKTAFRTRYGHYEFTVMPFGLTNAPGTFQAYMHKTLGELVDTCCVVYLDDIMIYSNSREEHETHLRQVFERLREYQLFAKFKKCEFFQERMEFLGFLVGAEGISMDPQRVQAIQEWPVPQCLKDVQSFLGFSNFYRRFIAGYSRLVAPLTSLARGAVKGKQVGEFYWTYEAQQAFESLKLAFQVAPILRHWEPDLETRVETDASQNAASGILSQLKDGQWRPVAYWSRKFNDTELRWGIGQKELLAIIESLEHWRRYLQWLPDRFLVLTDHEALKGVVNASAKDLQGRLARWIYRLSQFDFDVQHQKGSANRADALSRRPDYMAGEVTYDDVLPTLTSKLRLADEWPTELKAHLSPVIGGLTVRGLLSVVESPTVAAVTRSARRRVLSEEVPLVKPSLPKAVAERIVQDSSAWSPTASQQFATTVRLLQQSDPKIQALVAKTQHGRVHKGYHWDGVTPALLFRGRLVIPAEGALRESLLRQHHDDPRAGHFGAGKTLDLLTRKFHWKDIAGDVRRYVSSCEQCQGARMPTHRPYGSLQSLPLPEEPFQELTMDFISGLPSSQRDNGHEFDAILVVVDRFTKMGMFIPTTKTVTAETLARLFYEQVECRYGTPVGIVTDRDSLFTSHFWREFCAEKAITRRLSTAYHPQTDGQTERTHQTLVAYLRKFCSDDPSRWARVLHEAEFAYNNSKHATIGVSPFEALYGFHPRMIEWVRPSPDARVQGVKERLQSMATLRRRVRENWQDAVEAHKRYYDRKHQIREYHVGDLVGLSTKNFPFKKASKLRPTFIKVRVLQRVGKQAYKVALPTKYARLHDVFPITSLEPWDSSRSLGDDLPMPDLEDEQDEWELDEITAVKGTGSARRYLVKWKGWPVEYNTWEPEEHLQHAQTALRAFTKKHKRHKKWDDYPIAT